MQEEDVGRDRRRIWSCATNDGEIVRMRAREPCGEYGQTRGQLRNQVSRLKNSCATGLSLIHLGFCAFPLFNLSPIHRIIGNKVACKDGTNGQIGG